MTMTSKTSMTLSFFKIVLVLALSGSAWAAEPQPSSSSATAASQTNDVGDDNVDSHGAAKAESKEQVFEIEPFEVDIDVDIKAGKDGKAGQPGRPNVKIRKIEVSPIELKGNLRQAQIFPAGQMRNVTYLGVATASVSRTLGVHLKLPEGFGLMIVHVDKGSPADKAGLKPDDVLHKLGDQIIVNSAQLGTLVRSHKKDDKLKLTVIRKGSSKTIEATLAEKKMPVFSTAINNRQPVQLREAKWATPVGPQAFFLPGANPNQNQWMTPTVHMRWHDGTHDLTIVRKNGKKHLIAKDKDGKLLFDGPIETDKDRKSVPDAIKPKLEKLEKSTRMKFTPVQPNAIPGLEQGNADHRRIMKTIDAHLRELNEKNNRNPAGRDEQAANKQVLELRQRIHDDLQAQLKKLETEIEKNTIRGINAAVAIDPAAPNAVGRLNAAGTATASFSDNSHSLVLKVNEDGKHLTAKDNEGTVLFEGPVNTEAQRKPLPAAIRAKLKKLEDSTKIDVRIIGRP